MNKSESIVELASALSLAQKEMPKVTFNATNPFYKSKYADLGAIIETSKPVLAKYGLSISQLVTGGETPLGKHVVGINTMLIHKSGEWINNIITLPVDTDKNAAQEAGKTITYLRRYALSAILNMYADEDNDGNEGKKSPQTEEATPAKHSFGPRPYDAPTLRAAIAKRAKDCKPATPKQRSLVGALLSEYYLGDIERRHEAQLYLLGKSSVKDADGSKVTAMLNWMGVEEDSGGKYLISEMAKRELSTVLKAKTKEDGQQELL